MKQDRSTHHTAVMHLVGARLLSMAVGLITVPVMLRYLGSTGFAAWALCLALAAAYSILEVGTTTLVRFTAADAHRANWPEVRLAVGRTWILLTMTFSLAWVVVPPLSHTLSVWLQLPETILFKPAELILLVLAAYSLRALLQTGLDVMYAAGNFSAVSAVSLMQALCSNLAAILAAWQTRRLDLTLLAYWTAQIVVVGAGFVIGGRNGLPRFDKHSFNIGKLREMMLYSYSTQIDRLGQFVNFQFDKLIIAGWVGLWAVAPYEVANRAIAALRSLPVSGTESFLPGAIVTRSEPGKLWAHYVRSTRITAYACSALILAPLAVSPIFLYAWAGEMGYFGRWAFIALAVGTVANVCALPAVTLLQAAGQPLFQARAAIICVLVNVPLSLILVKHWGLAGAAVGTGIAMVISAVHLLFGAHRYFGMPLQNTIAGLLKFWPLLLVTLVWGLATTLILEAWFAAVAPQVRYSATTRIVPSLMAIATYALCLFSMLAIEISRRAFSPEELMNIGRIPGIKQIFPRSFPDQI